MINPMKLYEQLGGCLHAPYFEPQVYYTGQGIPYFRSPGLAVTTFPLFIRDQLLPFLRSFGNGAEKYISDPVMQDGGTEAIMAFAQGCYRSFWEKRTMRENADRYLMNLVRSGHNSTLRHANYGMQLWGVPRYMSAQLLRQSFINASETSQRYTDTENLRFYEHPAFTEDPVLHDRFEKRIEFAYSECKYLATYLHDKQEEGMTLLQAEGLRNRRKKVNEAARACLPNETETSLGITFNSDAARHLVDIRATDHADVVIRDLAVRFLLLMKIVSPFTFADYEFEEIADGTFVVQKTPQS